VSFTVITQLAIREIPVWKYTSHHRVLDSSLSSDAFRLCSHDSLFLPSSRQDDVEWRGFGELFFSLMQAAPLSLDNLAQVAKHGQDTAFLSRTIVKCEHIFEHLSTSMIGSNESHSIRLLILSFCRYCLHSILFPKAVFVYLSIRPLVTLPQVMSKSNTPSLSRAGSRSSLWRSWSPMLEDLVNYEKSRENYPWLIRDHDQDTSYDSNRSSRPRPLASLAEDPDAVSQSDQSRKSSEDLERHPAPEPLLLPQDEDPNLVSWPLSQPCVCQSPIYLSLHHLATMIIDAWSGNLGWSP
jgi:hypothetical protein